MLGVGRFQAAGAGNAADFAIVLRDEWQSRGLGEALVDFPVDIARQKQWKRIHALALSDNTKMINFFRKKKCSMKFVPDEGIYQTGYVHQGAS
ncbi:MAG: GNAT family N-acetyltransferase [Chitinivibrionales bacterium]|nr:GNAT family N-acetyltransferase [Chitinivibrionales bacterium]